MLCFLVILFSALISTNFGQYESPCPDIFEYSFDDAQRLSGKITTPASGFLGNAITLNVELSVGNSVNSYNGNIELIYARSKALEDIAAGRPLHYKVNFPMWRNIPPRVTKILINNNIICSGPPLDIKRVPVLTTINLQHSLKITNLNGFLPIGGNNFDNSNVQPIKDNPKKDENFGGGFFLQFGAQPTNHNNANQHYPQNPYFNLPSTSSNVNYYQGNPFFNIPSNDNSQGNSWNYFAGVTTERPYENPFIPTQRRTITSTTTTTTTAAPVAPPQEFIDEVPDIDIRLNLNDICGKSIATNQLIANGSPVISGYYPWLAALYTSKNLNLVFTCGGTLISNRHVLTAAHCLSPNDKKINIEQLLIILGKYNIQRWTNSKDGITVGAREITIHNDYRSLSADADIALITLTEQIRFKSFIRPICLWRGESELNYVVGQRGIVAGWGKDENGNTYSAEPKQVSLPIVGQEECLRSHADFADVTSSRTFCAGYRNGSGPCNGDSGGGFMMLINGRWTVRGVVSMSIADQARNCDLSQYLVFTDVSKFSEWILTTMR